MKTYKCFLCKGQPTFNVQDKKDAWEESHKHYMTYHFVPPKEDTQSS